MYPKFSLRVVRHSKNSKNQTFKYSQRKKVNHQGEALTNKFMIKVILEVRIETTNLMTKCNTLSIMEERMRANTGKRMEKAAGTVKKRRVALKKTILIAFNFNT